MVRKHIFTYTNETKNKLNMTAVFTRTQKDFNSMGFHPKKEFKRITKIEDIRGVHFSGVIKLMNWYDGEKSICEAYDELVRRHHELFNR